MMQDQLETGSKASVKELTQTTSSLFFAEGTLNI